MPKFEGRKAHVEGVGQWPLAQFDVNLVQESYAAAVDGTEFTAVDRITPPYDINFGDEADQHTEHPIIMPDTHRIIELLPSDYLMERGELPQVVQWHKDTP